MVHVARLPLQRVAVLSCFNGEHANASQPMPYAGKYKLYPCVLYSVRGQRLTKVEISGTLARWSRLQPYYGGSPVGRCDLLKTTAQGSADEDPAGEGIARANIA